MRRPPSASALDPVRSTPNAAIGVAGTVTTLAALDLGLDAYDRERVHGHRLTLAGAREQLERLAALPLAERRALPAIEPERAPVIVAGAMILVETLAHLGLDDDRGERARHPRRDRVRRGRAAGSRKRAPRRPAPSPAAEPAR